GGDYYAGLGSAVGWGECSARADQHVDEAAGAVLTQRLAGFQATLPDGSGQLISGAGANRQGGTEYGSVAAAVVVGILAQRW
ncbi:hypothetical protein ABTK15_20845, partial [Acinetobacter baumannii]